MKRTTALLAVAVAGLTACGGDKSEPPMTASFAFSYSGAASGSFNVTGAPSDGSPTGVFGFIDSGAAIVFGNKFINGSGSQLAVLVFTQGASGSVPITTPDTTTENLCATAQATCAAMVFMASTTVNGTTQELMCSLTSGALTLTVSTSSRSAGTFSGAGTCVDMSTDAVVGTITVTGGSFSANYGANPLAG